MDPITLAVIGLVGLITLGVIASGKKDEVKPPPPLSSPPPIPLTPPLPLPPPQIVNSLVKGQPYLINVFATTNFSYPDFVRYLEKNFSLILLPGRPPMLAKSNIPVASDAELSSFDAWRNGGSVDQWIVIAIPDASRTLPYSITIGKFIVTLRSAMDAKPLIFR